MGQLLTIGLRIRKSGYGFVQPVRKLRVTFVLFVSDRSGRLLYDVRQLTLSCILPRRSLHQCISLSGFGLTQLVFKRIDTCIQRPAFALNAVRQEIEVLFRFSANGIDLRVETVSERVLNRRESLLDLAS
jgi:hypothetical protein